MTVAATATDPEDADAFALERLACPVLVLRNGAAGIEHLLIGDDAGQIRLDVTFGSVLVGPVRFRYDLIGVVGVGPKLLTILRLVTLIRQGHLPRGFFPKPHRARRWMMALRAADARRAGASHLEIAVALFGRARVDADWLGHSGYLRCRVQRLIRLGEMLTQGGYRSLLR